MTTPAPDVREALYRLAGDALDVYERWLANLEVDPAMPDLRESLDRAHAAIDLSRPNSPPSPPAAPDVREALERLVPRLQAVRDILHEREEEWVDNGGEYLESVREIVSGCDDDIAAARAALSAAPSPSPADPGVREVLERAAAEIAAAADAASNRYLRELADDCEAALEADAALSASPWRRVEDVEDFGGVSVDWWVSDGRDARPAYYRSIQGKWVDLAEGAGVPFPVHWVCPHEPPWPPPDPQRDLRDTPTSYRYLPGDEPALASLASAPRPWREVGAMEDRQVLAHIPSIGWERVVHRSGAWYPWFALLSTDPCPLPAHYTPTCFVELPPDPAPAREGDEDA